MLTDEGSFETSNPLKPRQIVLASLSGVSITGYLSFLAAEEPTAWG